ncbi:MAG: hypothetical protein LBL31_03500 [Spirochaetaceae bacterium]|jgi:hypothetical protein|nr:hypothetical protein [Spirochaetaceae bacterium]
MSNQLMMNNETLGAFSATPETQVCGAEELPQCGNSFWSFAWQNSRSKSSTQICDRPQKPQTQAEGALNA